MNVQEFQNKLKEIQEIAKQNKNTLKALVKYTSTYHFTKVNRQLRITSHLYTQFRFLKDKFCSLPYSSISN